MLANKFTSSFNSSKGHDMAERTEFNQTLASAKIEAIERRMNIKTT